jgi:hypothetical protein
MQYKAMVSCGESRLSLNLGLSSPTGTDTALGFSHSTLSITTVDTAGTVQFQVPD